MARISGYVPQTDFAVNTLTVQEHMEFMARMKMDRRLKSSLRKQRIVILLTDLGLVKCCNTKLSALLGEKKNFSLAVQLLIEPSILFCDEPTTGLDSFGAMFVIHTLRELATSGRIVICSIHQPASGLLDFFHEVILLSVGRVAFQGSTADAMTFFDGLGLEYPSMLNKAEFYITQLSVYQDKERERLSYYITKRWICDEFEHSKYINNISQMINELSYINAFVEVVKN